jgi:hypothetical protein
MKRTTDVNLSLHDETAKNRRQHATGPKFLHLIPDDKFIDGARELFEKAAPGQHDYLLSSKGSKLRFIKTFEPLRYDSTIAPPPHMLAQIAHYDAIFVHYLTPAARLIIDKAPKATRIIWLGWGADYYHLICDQDNLYTDATKIFLSKIVTKSSTTRNLDTLSDILKSARKGILNPSWAVRRYAALRRLHHIGPGQPGERNLLTSITDFAPVITNDYDAIKLNNPDFPPRLATWNYPSIESVSRSRTQYVAGKNILVGNSATPENNHIDTLQLIHKVANSERKIICPLSYGQPSYGEAIATEGRKLFGSRFIPLRQFMDAESYTTALHSCSIAAMNHIRQQALGNILMMLWMGAHVFLNRRSPVIHEMKRLGIHLLDVRELPDFLEHDVQAVQEDVVMDIRDRLNHRYGQEALVALTRALLDNSTNKAPPKSGGTQSGKIPVAPARRAPSAESTRNENLLRTVVAQ